MIWALLVLAFAAGFLVGWWRGKRHCARRWLNGDMDWLK